MKTLRKQAPFFGAEGLELFAPVSWKELTQNQLRYVYLVLGTFEPMTAKTYILSRFSGLHIVKRTCRGWSCFVRTGFFHKRKFIFIQDWQIHTMLQQLKFVDSYENMDVRLDSIQGYRAVDLLLHGVAFLDYLNVEKLYQAYLSESDNTNKYLVSMACILYRNKKGASAKIRHIDVAEETCIFLWFSYIKYQLSVYFPHFLKKLSSDETGDFDMLSAMNAQIRALTEGDITKENKIFNMDCWRALTELDQKARESDEFKQKYGK